MLKERVNQLEKKLKPKKDYNIFNDPAFVAEYAKEDKPRKDGDK